MVQHPMYTICTPSALMPIRLLVIFSGHHYRLWYPFSRFPVQMSAHNVKLFRLFSGTLGAAQFVAFTQLITKPRIDVSCMEVLAIQIFSFTIPLLAGLFLQPPRLDAPLDTRKDFLKSILHFGLFFASVVASLVALDLLFWNISTISGLLFPPSCAVAFYATFRLHIKADSDHKPTQSGG